MSRAVSDFYLFCCLINSNRHLQAAATLKSDALFQYTVTHAFFLERLRSLQTWSTAFTWLLAKTVSLHVYLNIKEQLAIKPPHKQLSGLFMCATQVHITFSIIFLFYFFHQRRTEIETAMLQACHTILLTAGARFFASSEWEWSANWEIDYRLIAIGRRPIRAPLHRFDRFAVILSKV